eukprot:s1796_g15.t1
MVTARAVLLLSCVSLVDSSRVAGHDHSIGLETSEVGRGKRVESKTAHEPAASKGGHEDTDLHLPHTAVEVTRMRGSTDGCLFEAGERMGCHAGCPCSWFEQCYPKFVYLPGVSAQINIGVCGLAMPVLALVSVILFFSLIGSVVAARMWLSKEVYDDRNTSFTSINETKGRLSLQTEPEAPNALSPTRSADGGSAPGDVCQLDGDQQPTHVS